MACRDWRTVAREDALRKAALIGVDATAEQRLAALSARAEQRDRDNVLPKREATDGARMLAGALGADGRDDFPRS
jgi:hypothetical protein